MDMDLMVTMLTMTAARLPILIALAVSVVWVVDTPAGALRSVALSALALLAVTTLAGLVLNVVPVWLVAQGNYETVQGMSGWLGAGHFVLSLLEALAVVLLVWAMTRALRSLKAARPA